MGSKLNERTHVTGRSPQLNRASEERQTKRILLSGVFGPFGVDDEYGRKENIMELFHNQVTKGQGLGSFRFHHRSFGLYFLAENIDADVTVLDFPSKEDFTREVARGYDIVGVSFITPNFRKAQEMARLTRSIAPGAEIILGGHGAAIEGVETLIDCDHVVKGEGIRWLRSHLGQDPDAPIVHPILPSTERMSIYGLPLPGITASLLVPGVGCVNGCSFCSTSHFFGKKYTSFLDTGKALFEAACRIADARGTDHFFIMDENFLKDRERALSLLDQMERHKRFFRFSIFSSAEAIEAFGLDRMVRLGVTLVWIGFESRSRQSEFAKNTGVDARALVRGLRDRGISVLGSGILCMEHHTPEYMQEDIDYLVDLETDFVQFMLLTPLPTTALYERHKRKGLLDQTLPFEEWHGQKRLNFHHPAFGPDEPEQWINHAFRQDFLENCSSMYRVAETSLRGYLHLREKSDRDENLERRMRQFEAQAREYALLIPAISRFSESLDERRRAQQLDACIISVFGRSKTEHLKAIAVAGIVARWKLRIGLFGDEIQPNTIRTHYPRNRRALAPTGSRTPLNLLKAGLQRIPATAALLTALIQN